METAVSIHFDVDCCGLVSDRDFMYSFDYDQEYEFVLYNGSGSGDDDEYVTLFMTYAPLFTEIDVTHYIHGKEVSND